MIDLKQFREKLFPDVIDFSDPMDHFIYGDSKKLTPAEILWFKPEFYKDFTKFYCIGLSIALFITTLILLLYGKITYAIIPGIATFIQIRFSIKTIKNLKYQGDINLWDLAIRDTSTYGKKVKGKYEYD